MLRKRITCRSAFSLFEVLVVIAIMAIIIGGASLYLHRNSGGIRLDTVASEVVTLLRSAQQKAANQDDGTRWGVHVDNLDLTTRGFSLFSVSEDLINSGTTDVPGTTEQRIGLSSSIDLINPEAGTIENIVFEKGTGLPSTTGTVTLSTGTLTRTISVEANGRITY